MYNETKKSIEHIANLARIELNEASLLRYADQSEKIIDYFNKLNELDTANIKPASHAIDTPSPLREDKVIKFQNVDGILDQVPEKDGPFIQVPKVI